MMGEEFSGTADPTKGRTSLAPPHFVLIHGVGGGGWCWYKMKCLMENSGYKVTCLDLKGAGMDHTDPNTILSFQDHNKPLIDFLSSLDHEQQVILVGHSAGGLSLTDAIVKFGKKKIKLAIFVAATMLKSGFITDQDVKDLSDSVSEIRHSIPTRWGYFIGYQNRCRNSDITFRQDGVPDLSDFGELNEVYEMGYGLGEGCPPTTILVKKEFQKKIIYQLSPIEDSTLAAMLLRPGPVQAL